MNQPIPLALDMKKIATDAFNKRVWTELDAISLQIPKIAQVGLFKYTHVLGSGMTQEILDEISEELATQGYSVSLGDCIINISWVNAVDV